MWARSSARKAEAKHTQSYCWGKWSAWLQGRVHEGRLGQAFFPCHSLSYSLATLWLWTGFCYLGQSQ